MSTAALPHVSSPDDEDLANLYHQVLAGFAEESPTTEQSLRNGDGESDTLYSNYGDDGGDTPTTTRQQRLTVTPSVRGGTWVLAYIRVFHRSVDFRPYRSSTFATSLSTPSVYCSQCAVPNLTRTASSPPHPWAAAPNANTSSASSAGLVSYA